MKRIRMEDSANMVRINQFRQKFGLSQDQMATLLGINRGQISHLEKVGRHLALEAEKKFTSLTEGIDAQYQEPGERNFAKEQQDKRDLFLWKSGHDLIAMQHDANALEEELPRLAKRENELLTILENWNNLSQTGKTLLTNGYSPDFIERRYLAKLAKCDIRIQLEKQAQIQKLRASVAALKQFLADYRNSRDADTTVQKD